MTDLEALLRILRSLGLKDSDAANQGWMVNKNFTIRTNVERTNFTRGEVIPTRVTLGAGDGYFGFCVDFDFDASGKAIGHAVYE